MARPRRLDAPTRSGKDAPGVSHDRARPAPAVERADRRSVPARREVSEPQRGRAGRKVLPVEPADKRDGGREPVGRRVELGPGDARVLAHRDAWVSGRSAACIRQAATIEIVSSASLTCAPLRLVPRSPSSCPDDSYASSYGRSLFGASTSHCSRLPFSASAAFRSEIQRSDDSAVNNPEADPSRLRPLAGGVRGDDLRAVVAGLQRPSPSPPSSATQAAPPRPCGFRRAERRGRQRLAG